MQNITINIAKDFDPYPSGRTDVDGPFNGNKFRKEILEPKIKSALENKKILIIDLGGLMSHGSSFFEEAFGGLIRNSDLTAKQIENTIEYKVDMDFRERYVDAIKGYIKNAKK